MNTSANGGRKFLFDSNNFDLPESEPEPEVYVEPDPIFSLDDLGHAKDDAFAKGRAAGLEEARVSREQYLASQTNIISQELKFLIGAEEYRAAVYEREVIALTETIFKTLLPVFSESEGIAPAAAQRNRGKADQSSDQHHEEHHQRQRDDQREASLPGVGIRGVSGHGFLLHDPKSRRTRTAPVEALLPLPRSEAEVFLEEPAQILRVAQTGLHRHRLQFHVVLTQHRRRGLDPPRDEVLADGGAGDGAIESMERAHRHAALARQRAHRERPRVLVADRADGLADAGDVAVVRRRAAFVKALPSGVGVAPFRSFRHDRAVDAP